MSLKRTLDKAKVYRFKHLYPGGENIPIGHHYEILSKGLGYETYAALRNSPHPPDLGKSRERVWEFLRAQTYGCTWHEVDAVFTLIEQLEVKP